MLNYLKPSTKPIYYYFDLVVTTTTTTKPMASSTQKQQQPHLDTSSSAATAAAASLTAELTSPVSPETPHSATDAQRGMSHVDSWQPQFNRRQSWSKEEHKHAMQMGDMRDVATGPGFSERA